MLNAQFPDLTQIYETDLTLYIKEVMLSHISISPNPTSDDAFLSFNLLENNNVTIEVYDLVGNLCFTKESFYSFGEHTEVLDITSFASGRYSVRLSVNGEQIGVVGFVVGR